MKRSSVSVASIVIVLSSAVLVLAQAKRAAPKAAPQSEAASVPSRSASALATMPAEPPVLAAAREYPTFGVAIAPVQGWDRLQGRDPEIIAQWCHIDAQAVNMDGVIAALVEPAAGHKLDEFARQVAEDATMQITDETTHLGGQSAMILTGSAEEKLFHSARAILCQRGGYFYELVSYGVQAQDWRDQLQVMAQSWKWTDFQPTEKFLAPLDQSVSLFNGLLAMQAPAIIRAYKVPQPDDLAYLAIYDYLLNRPIFTLDVQRMNKDVAIAPEVMQQDYARQLDAKLKLPKPLAWQKLPGPMPIFLSAEYDVTPAPQKPAATKDAKAKPAITLPVPTGQMTLRSGLAFPSGSEALVITFGISASQDPARQAYINLAEQMALTFTSKPPASAPTPTEK